MYVCVCVCAEKEMAIGAIVNSLAVFGQLRERENENESPLMLLLLLLLLPLPIVVFFSLFLFPSFYLFICLAFFFSFFSH